MHIPYVAPPEWRANYSTFTENEADYYGTLSALDAQVGRIRALLRELGIADNTMVVFTADNGPEVDDASGHDTAPFPNPGRTNGLRGRKRDLTEGGIGVMGLVEYPALITANRVEPLYPAVTMDLLPTFLELSGAPNLRPDWPLDGASWVPFLRGEAGNRSAAIGWYSDFIYAITNHADNTTCSGGNTTLPAKYAPLAGQPQFAWVEGPLKLWGCTEKTSGQWHLTLFDIGADRSETVDAWQQYPGVGEAMYNRFLAWQANVAASRINETGCLAGSMRDMGGKLALTA